MDRRGRSLPVQFWLTVESFKNPLESVDSSSSGEEYEPLSDPISATTLREDLKMINDLYFSNSVTPTALSCISQKYVEAIRMYAAQGSATAIQERKARRSVMLAQRQVEQDMDHDFEDFRRSDLWFRAISDLDPKKGEIHSPVSPKPISKVNTSASSGLLASLVQGLTSDISLGHAKLKPSLFHRPESTHSATAPVVTRHRLSIDSGRASSIPSPRLSRSFSAQGASSSLEFLMSSSPDIEDSGSMRAPLFDEGEDGRLLSADADEAQRMEAIQAAVTDIIASENNQEGEQRALLPISESLHHPISSDNHITLPDKHRAALFSDSPTSAENYPVPLPNEEELKETLPELAVPGDLHLSDEISRITDKIAHVQSQDTILDALIRKAELTGDEQELRLLKKSKSSLEREVRQLSFQKIQLEQHDHATKLIPGKTKASIVNATTGEESGKQVVRYLIEVQQVGSGWIVARRYSEFLNLHQRLKEKYLSVKNLEFPGKHLVTALSTQMVDNRRVALEKYLQVSSQ